MIIVLIENYLVVVLTMELTHAGEIIWRDTWYSFIHSWVDLKLQTLHKRFAYQGFLLLVGRAESPPPLETCMEPSSLAFYFYILRCDYWERSLVVLVFLMVEVFTARVDIGFSSWLEGCACLEPPTEQSRLRPGVYLHLVESIFLFFLRNGNSKSSCPPTWCQYELGLPFILSFNSNLKQVNTYPQIDFRLIFL